MTEKYHFLMLKDLQLATDSFIDKINKAISKYLLNSEQSLIFETLLMYPSVRENSLNFLESRFADLGCYINTVFTCVNENWIYSTFNLYLKKHNLKISTVHLFIYSNRLNKENKVKDFNYYLSSYFNDEFFNKKILDLNKPEDIAKFAEKNYDLKFNMSKTAKKAYEKKL
jgi:hypothetical protein